MNEVFWKFLRVLGWGLGALLVVVVLLLSPAGYVELFCRADAEQNAFAPAITDTDFQRAEANSYLTYPEWHIVYAYEGLAKVLETGDEHQFDYLSSIFGFWKSYCVLNRTANRHGGGDLETRMMVHTIGVSFTFEMAMKALYEETYGRLFAAIRGSEKTPQDIYAAEMAADYAQFLQQVPWYKYDFANSVDVLWDRPIQSTLRGWERRLALGGEWNAKVLYAKGIANAVAATGQAQLRIRSIVEKMSPSQLQSLDGVDVVEVRGEQVVIETPRYREFTHILNQIARNGGQIVEIAGNDEIMVSVIEVNGAIQDTIQGGENLVRLSRDGYEGSRVLVSVKIRDLAGFLSALGTGSRTLEHIYDY